MVSRRRLGSILKSGGDLGSMVAKLQSQSGTTEERTDEATCLGAGGTWNEELELCTGASPTLPKDRVVITGGQEMKGIPGPFDSRLRNS
jgi:hypothetical protein